MRSIHSIYVMYAKCSACYGFEAVRASVWSMERVKKMKNSTRWMIQMEQYSFCMFHNWELLRWNETNVSVHMAVFRDIIMWDGIDFAWKFEHTNTSKTLHSFPLMAKASDVRIASHQSLHAANKFRSSHLTALAHKLRAPPTGANGEFEFPRNSVWKWKHDWCSFDSPLSHFSLLVGIRFENGSDETESRKLQLMPITKWTGSERRQMGETYQRNMERN